MTMSSWNAMLPLLLIGIASKAAYGNEMRMTFIDPKVAFSSPHILRIGTSLTLDSTTKYSTLGNAVKNAYFLYFDWLNNYKGGVMINGNMHLVELTLIGDSSNKQNVRRITEHLIGTENISILLGPYSSGNAREAAAVVNASGAVMVAPTGTSTSVYKGRPNVFGLLTPSASFLPGAFMLLKAAENNAPKTVAFVQENVGWTKGICSKIQPLSTANGMQLLSDGQFTVPGDASQAQVQGVVTNLTRLSPDIVMMCTYRIACHSLLKEMRRQKFYAKAILATICVTESDFMDVLGTAAQYVLGVTPWLSELPLTSATSPGWTAASFADKYNVAYKGLPGYQAASAFAACSVLVHSIETANSTDPLLIADQLRKSNHETVFGTVAFDKDNQGTNEMRVVQFQFTAKAKLIYPPENANALLAYPKPSWIAMECKNIDVGAKSRYGLVSGNCIQCAIGMQSQVVNSSSGEMQRLCVKCGAGRMGVDADYQSCVKCPAGSKSDTTGAVSCQLCPMGSFQNASGQSSCPLCEAGGIAPRNGSQICQDCPEGSSQAMDGQASCVPCAIGTYANISQQVACTACPNGLTTMSTFAKDVQECKCDEESYSLTPGGSCQACPDGMQCDFGLDLQSFGNDALVQPLLLMGYWSSRDDPMMPYRCTGPEVCPGGKVNSCSGSRVGIACGKCPERMVPTAKSCKDCNTFGVALLVVSISLSPILPYYMLRDAHKWRLTVAESLALTMELTCEIVQVIGALAMMSVEWPDPEILNVLGDISLDAIMPSAGMAECIFNTTANSSRYMFLALVVPVFLVLTWCFYGILKHLNFLSFGLIPKGYNWTFTRTWNVSGKVFNVVFVSQVAVSMMPFMCYGHPSPNTESSILEFSATLCGTSDHYVMLVIGIISICGCLAFLASICVVLWWAPKHLNGMGGERYMSMITFIVEDFRLECFYFNIPAKIQELLLALVMVAFPDDSRMQILTFSAIFVLSLACIAGQWPLKSPLVNLMVVVVYSMLILVLCAIHVALPSSMQSDINNAGNAICVFALFLYVAAIGSLILSTVNWLTPAKNGCITTLMQLQRSPNHDTLVHDWRHSAHVSTDHLQTLLKHWQIYDINELAFTLRSICPKGSPALLRSNSMRRGDSGLRKSFARIEKDMLAGQHSQIGEPGSIILGTGSASSGFADDKSMILGTGSASSGFADDNPFGQNASEEIGQCWPKWPVNATQGSIESHTQGSIDSTDPTSLAVAKDFTDSTTNLADEADEEPAAMPPKSKHLPSMGRGATIESMRATIETI